MKDIIKTIIKDFHNRGIPRFIEREIKIPLNPGKIVSIIGARRAGKTYAMYQVMSKVKDITNIIYINFEDERLEISLKDLYLIIDSYFEIYPDKKEKDLFFFFDEIQEIKGWEKFVRRVYDSVSKNIFITGSSSKLLSKEISSNLRGRTVTYEIFPLSFREYLKFKDLQIDLHSTKGKSKIMYYFSEYITKGGFPETISMDEEIYKKTLTSYFELMIYKDIAERYLISNFLPLKMFIKKLISNTSKEFSINKIFNEFKSQGIKISKDTIYNYLDYCEDSYIILPINNFSESATKQIIKKSYSIDTGLSSMVSFSLSKDKGRLFENLVLLELKRKYDEIYYYKEEYECDFIIKERDKIVKAIQVCYEFNENNKEREIKGLKEAMNKFKLNHGIILTINEEEELEGIKIIPVQKWLLEN